jgi:hypothetical protein
MPKESERPDLGRVNATSPDRGQPSGHTPADHAEVRRRPNAGTTGPDHADPTEKARPHDSGRSGA